MTRHAMYIQAEIGTASRHTMYMAGAALHEPGRSAAPLVLRLHLVVGAQVLVEVGAPAEHATAEVAACLAGVHGHVAAVGVDVAVHGAAQLAPVHCNTAPAHRDIR